jgi:hypothetical protein
LKEVKWFPGPFGGGLATFGNSLHGALRVGPATADRSNRDQP